MKKRAVQWWKSGSKADVAKGMCIALSTGEPAPDWFAHVNYSRAAFCYEHEARVNQKSCKAKSPCYRYQKPFPELTQKRKDDLKTEFPSKGWTLLPWERSTRTTKPEKLSDPPPSGWIDIHFWVEPNKTDKRQVLKAIADYFDSEKQALGIPRGQLATGVRKKEYPWKSLAIVDAFLKGTDQEDFDKSHAWLVLRRRY